MTETQECRDCGTTFPYDADADRCHECVAELIEDAQEDADYAHCAGELASLPRPWRDRTPSGFVVNP